MLDNELPEFDRRAHGKAQTLARRIFGEAFVRLDSFDDGHFRVLFLERYFTMQPGNDAPSKSQWSTLKKKIKRHDRDTFVFKETGMVSDAAERMYFLDFGFFLYP